MQRIYKPSRPHTSEHKKMDYDRDDARLCQSLLPFIGDAASLGRAKSNFYDVVLRGEGYGDVEPHEARRRRECVEAMIANEKAAFADGIAVFYRVIRDNYVLYRFNSLMLELFCPYFPRTPHKFFCVPSLRADAYPPSVAGVVSQFGDRTVGTDMELQACLISVNCVLDPRGQSARFHDPRLWHSSEASPMQFVHGYNETLDWQSDLPGFMAHFFGIAHTRPLFNQLMRAYRARRGDETGHCVQLFVPTAALDAFAYPCLDYGLPVWLYSDNGATRCGPRFEHVTHGREVAPPGQPLPLERVLFSPHNAHIQARLLAHPDLFLRHGARCIVHSASFDDEAFVQDMRAILAPHIDRAIATGRTLAYTGR